jgi:hypothetical protein
VINMAGNWITGSKCYLQSDVFTGSGTWTRPTNVTACWVLLVGGGGGGGGEGGGTGKPGGGGGAEVSFACVPVSGDASITIGGGGAHGAGSANGSNGGTTTFVQGSVNISAIGGNGGVKAGYSSNGAGGSGGGYNRGAANSGNGTSKGLLINDLVVCGGGGGGFGGNTLSGACMGVSKINGPTGFGAGGSSFLFNGIHYGGGGKGNVTHPSDDGNSGLCIVFYVDGT